MSLGPETLVLGLVWYAVFVFSTTLHEAAHAYAALRLGDRTAYEGGQVSLNPLPHIVREPIGMVVVPILSFLFFYQGRWMIGWASAPYDPQWASSYPRRAAWMALAGPLSNLLLVVASGLAIRAGMIFGAFAAPATIEFSSVTVAVAPGIFSSLATVCSIVFSLNLILFVFNLLPLPPLDGSGVVPLVLPESWARRYLDLVHHPSFGLVGILVAWKIFAPIFGPIHTLALNLLYPGAGYH